MSLSTWLGFLLAAILISVTPGPGAVLSMGAGMRYGYLTALKGILGLQAAILLQIVIVAFGLGALLATSETAFQLLKFGGALYLVWLGISRWRSPVQAFGETQALQPKDNLFREAVLVNMTNPKAIIFICALLPQFVDAAKPLVPQYALIAGTLCATDLAVMSIYAVSAASLGRYFNSAQVMRRQNRFFGGAFVLAGAWLMFSSGH